MADGYMADGWMAHGSMLVAKGSSLIGCPGVDRDAISHQPLAISHDRYLRYEP
jgi:hypothetical protein